MSILPFCVYLQDISKVLPKPTVRFSVHSLPVVFQFSYLYLSNLFNLVFIYGRRRQFHLILLQIYAGIYQQHLWKRQSFPHCKFCHFYWKLTTDAQIYFIYFLFILIGVFFCFYDNIIIFDYYTYVIDFNIRWYYAFSLTIIGKDCLAIWNPFIWILDYSFLFLLKMFLEFCLLNVNLGSMTF